MESGGNKGIPNPEESSLESSAPVGHAHPHAEQFPPTPHSSKDTEMSDEKTADSEPHHVSSSIDSWWGWDILALSLSLAILIAIIVILRVYDGKQQPNWQLISLNTLLSWLSTVAKGCIAVCLSSGISQLKWVWFAQGKRPLSDLGVFDNASRGLYGSAELLWVLRMRYFAVFGAIGVLLAVGFDPFVQNLVQYTSDNVVDESKICLLANTTEYSGLGPRGVGASSYYIEPTFKGNIYNSIFSTDSGRPWAIPQYSCPTGNCTWDPIASLAVRALCSDVTPSIQTKCERHEDTSSGFPYNNCTVSLPNGASAYYNGGYETEAIVLKAQWPSQPIVYTNATLPVIQRIEALVASSEEGVHIAAKVRDDPRYVATECSLEPIVRSVKTFVDNSKYHETVLAEWTKIEPWNSYVPSEKGYSLLPNWNESLGAYPGQNFTLFPQSHTTIENFMKALFSGNAFASMQRLVFRMDGDPFESYATVDVMQAFMYGNITGCADNKNNRFSCTMRNIADAMSKSFRDQAYLDNGRDAKMAVGYTQQNATMVRVDWQWLTLPLLVWLLGALTWLGTGWKTRRVNLPWWNDNPLPLLFLYHNGDDIRTDKVQGVSSQAYEQRAKSIRAHLYTANNQAGFVE